MDNPYQQRQAQLLQRIASNAQKCTEAITMVNEVFQDIVAANADAETAAEIFALYRKIVKDSLAADTNGETFDIEIDGVSSATVCQPMSI